MSSPLLFVNGLKIGAEKKKDWNTTDTMEPRLQHAV